MRLRGQDYPLIHHHAGHDRGYLEGTKLRTLLNPLTQRECKIQQLLEMGMTHREIADELGISKAHVGNRVRILRAKLRVNSVDEMLCESKRLGVLRSGRRVPTVKRSALEALRAEPRRLVITPRELDVLHALRRFPNLGHREIAEKLGVSKALIDQCSVALQRKLAVKGRVALMEQARRRRG